MAGCAFCEKGVCKAKDRIGRRVYMDAQADKRENNNNQADLRHVQQRLEKGEDIPMTQINALTARTDKFVDYAQRKAVEYQKLIEKAKVPPSVSDKPSWRGPLVCVPYANGYRFSGLEEQQSECSHNSGTVFQELDAIKRNS